MESKGLKVNMEKTKLMITDEESRHGVQSGRWPCCFCGKGVGVNLLLCIECNKWCHLRCSGLKRVSGVQGFPCSSCKERKNIEDAEKELITTGGKTEEVDEFWEMYWIARLD